MKTIMSALAIVSIMATTGFAKTTNTHDTIASQKKAIEKWEKAIEKWEKEIEKWLKDPTRTMPTMPSLSDYFDTDEEPDVVIDDPNPSTHDVVAPAPVTPEPDVVIDDPNPSWTEQEIITETNTGYDHADQNQTNPDTVTSGGEAQYGDGLEKKNKMTEGSGVYKNLTEKGKTGGGSSFTTGDTSKKMY